MKWQQYLLARTICVCPALAFVAGFVDAATFVRGGGVFCAHVTGNLIVMASQFVHQQRVGKLAAATLLTFTATAALVALAYRSLRRFGEARALRSFLVVESGIIAVALLCAVLSPGSVPRRVIVLCLVVAMALQTTLQRLAPGLGTVTTVMTGNLTQCFVDLSGQRAHGDLRPRCHGRVIASFLTGCVLGAALVGSYGFSMLLIPLGVLLRAALHESLASPGVSLAPADELGLRSACCGELVDPAE